MTLCHEKVGVAVGIISLHISGLCAVRRCNAKHLMMPQSLNRADSYDVQGRKNTCLVEDRVDN